MVLHLVCHVRIGRGLCWCYGLSLLQLGFAVLPWGLDWPVLRTISGAAFALGLVGLLWLLPQEQVGRGSLGPPTRLVWLVSGWAAGLCVLLWGLLKGGLVTGRVLAGLGVVGAAGLSLLALLNVCVLLASALRRLRACVVPRPRREVSG